jgi:hypothetical protein
VTLNRGYTSDSRSSEKARESRFSSILSPGVMVSTCGFGPHSQGSNPWEITKMYFDVL